ncbi:MAG: HD domain-containing protein [Bacteroidota bacterium]
MRHSSFNSRKIFNDPVYGFIPVGDPILFDIIEHPWFQRLRRIKQLGMTDMVYPGALHTRFHHSVGAMHLMTHAINALRLKGADINEQEALDAAVAILLHDIGHGPFSHALENSIIHGIDHELISKLYMDKLNQIFGGALKGAIRIFENSCERRFLHQLVSSQLDMDRLDYLKRDSFYTGVSEGVVNAERIIKMLFVEDDRIVVEEKGIYSIEKFILARRLMYWQVYLHKTVLSAENMLMNILRRARKMSLAGESLFATPVLEYFLKNKVGKDELMNDKGVLELFSQLDDYDIYAAIKVWTGADDPVLSKLCKMLVNRELFACELQNEAFREETADEIRACIAGKYNLSEDDASYFLVADSTENHAYHPRSDKINIMYRSGEIIDIAHASDQLNITALHKTVTKFFLCFPKEFRDCL